LADQALFWHFLTKNPDFLKDSPSTEKLPRVCHAHATNPMGKLNDYRSRT
jgi:hypothetical protein